MARAPETCCTRAGPAAAAAREDGGRFVRVYTHTHEASKSYNIYLFFSSRRRRLPPRSSPENDIINNTRTKRIRTLFNETNRPKLFIFKNTQRIIFIIHATQYHVCASEHDARTAPHTHTHTRAPGAFRLNSNRTRSVHPGIIGFPVLVYRVCFRPSYIIIINVRTRRGEETKDERRRTVAVLN